MPRRRAPHVPILERGGRQGAAALLDDGVRGLPDEIQMHDGAGAKDHVLDAVQQRLDANPNAMRQRRETVEHPFGTFKARMGATHFLTKTLPTVAAEMALHVLAYNLTRVMNIIGIKPLMATLTA